MRYNANGTLDSTFGAGGEVITRVPTSTNDVALDAAPAWNGKVVVGGESVINGSGRMMVARYNANGSLDTTFSTDGITTANFAETSLETAYAVIETGGKLVAAGRAGQSDAKMAVARWNSNGSFDTTFGNSGKVLVDFAGWDTRAFGLDVQADGKIVLGGRATSLSDPSDVRFAVARLNTNGGLDSTFSGDGRLLVSFAGFKADASGIAVGNDKGQLPWIVVAGSARVGSDSYFALAYISPSGVLEPTFEGDGRMVFGFPGSSWQGATSVDLDPSGRIVVGGSALFGDFTFAIARVHANGTFDTSFAGDGMMTVGFSGVTNEHLSEVRTGPTGAIAAVGRVINSAFTAQYAAVARLNPDGTLMNSFSGDGKLLFDAPFVTHNVGTGVVFGANDKITVVGWLGEGL
jgi:uncharacterized delta-60 repeat protein